MSRCRLFLSTYFPDPRVPDSSNRGGVTSTNRPGDSGYQDSRVSFDGGKQADDATAARLLAWFTQVMFERVHYEVETVCDLELAVD